MSELTQAGLRTDEGDDKAGLAWRFAVDKTGANHSGFEFSDPDGVYTNVDGERLIINGKNQLVASGGITHYAVYRLRNGDTRSHVWTGETLADTDGYLANDRIDPHDYSQSYWFNRPVLSVPAGLEGLYLAGIRVTWAGVNPISIADVIINPSLESAEDVSQAQNDLYLPGADFNASFWDGIDDGLTTYFTPISRSDQARFLLPADGTGGFTHWPLFFGWRPGWIPGDVDHSGFDPQYVHANPLDQTVYVWLYRLADWPVGVTLNEDWSWSGLP